MAIVTGDWSVTRSNGNVRYIGNDHTGNVPSYATVIEFHRWLQGLADDASAQGDDEVDITDELPSNRSTDNIITLLGLYNIDDTAAEHLYDGSVIQGAGITEDIFDGIVNFGNSGIPIQIIQSGAVVVDDWWNSNEGLNPDGTQGISHRFMVKTRQTGVDLDGRRLIGTSREYLNTYSEFSINGTSRGNNVLALVNSLDLNNTTASGTVGTYDTIIDNGSDSTTVVSTVESPAALSIGVDDSTVFTTGQFVTIFPEIAEYQVTGLFTNGLGIEIGPALEVATTGDESVKIVGHGYELIDVDNNTVNEDYYSEWTKASFTINQFYERMKYLTRDGSTHRLYGLNGEVFRGITHEITVDTPTGIFADVEEVSWGSGATAGKGQMLATNSVSNPTKIWIQLLSGVIPTDGLTITGTVSAATCDMDTTIVERTISKPFVGQSTGSALIGAYGIGLATASLTATDKVTDLTDTVINPPNNVTFTVGGLSGSEDRVLVGPWDGVELDNEGNPAIDKDQFIISGAYSGAAEAAIVVHSGIPSDTPATGDIRIGLSGGSYREIEYFSWASNTFTIPSTDFSSDAATGNLWIAYIDELAAGAESTFTSVYGTDRNLVVIVRDGGGTPIKQFISSATLGSNGGSVTAIRTTDA